MPGETDPTVIERVQLADLSLSAIVVASDPSNNIAMLEHGGVGYLVHKGSKIGSKNGVVREITASTVVIEEPGSVPGGGVNVVELSLPQ
jgi:type II secretory pathway component PulC